MSRGDSRTGAIKTSLVLSRSLHRWLKRHAIDEDTTLLALAEAAIMEYAKARGYQEEDEDSEARTQRQKHERAE